jgi:hypothetical protein
MPIHANGSSSVKFTSSAAVGLGVAQAPFSWVAIVNAADVADWRALYAPDGATFFLTSGGAHMRLEENGTNTDSPTIVVATGEWVLIGITKASGTATPRFHYYRFSTNAWSHENASGSTAAVNHTGPSIYLGGAPATYSNFWNGEIEVFGHWKRVLSDAEIENLPFTLQGWYSAKPDILIKADPTSVKLSDSSQDSTLSTTDAGITASTSSVPIFNYTDGVWAPVIAAATSTIKVISAAINGSSTVTATLNVARNLPASINGSSTVTASVVATRKLTAAIAGSSTVTASLKAARVIGNTITGSALVTASVVATRKLTASIAGSSTVTAILSGGASIANLVRRANRIFFRLR